MILKRKKFDYLSKERIAEAVKANKEEREFLKKIKTLKFNGKNGEKWGVSK